VEFFNPKTEILRFQFTSYGLEELSKGKFEPTLFVAHDEGVLYDQTLSEEEFLEDVRTNQVFVKTNKLFYELEDVEVGQEAVTESVAYQVREELEDDINLAKSSFHIRVSGTDVIAATQSNDGIAITADDVFVLKSEEIPLSEIPNKSETETTNLRLVDGKYFMFENGNMLLDVIEGGTTTQPENFECFLYELVEGEEVRVDLKGEERESNIFSMSDTEPKFWEVQILCDEEIPDEILCKAKSAMYAGDSSNIFLTDDGVVSNETLGKTCRMTVSTKPAVYFGRKEGELGDGCRTS